MKRIIGLVSIALFTGYLGAQDITIEGSLMAQQMSGDVTYMKMEEESIRLEVDKFMGYGFQAGMNFGKLNLGMDFIFGNTDIISTNTFEVAVTCIDIDLEYSFLHKPISPIIVAGIGSVNYTESFTSSEGLNESDFSYNVASGIKWIINERIYVKPTYRFTFSKIKDTTDGMLFHGISIGVGYIFKPAAWKF